MPIAPKNHHRSVHLIRLRAQRRNRHTEQKQGRVQAAEHRHGTAGNEGQPGLNGYTRRHALRGELSVWGIAPQSYLPRAWGAKGHKSLV